MRLTWASTSTFGAAFFVLGTVMALGCATEADEDGDDEGGTVTKGDDIEDTDPPPPPASSCVAACTVEQMCLGGSLDACSATCTTDRDFYSSDRGFECVGKFDALLGCIAALTCPDAVTYADGYAETYPCQLEEETFVSSCLLEGDPAPAACVALCEKVATCAISDVTDCEASCAQQIGFATALSEECGTAQTDLLVCAEALECGDVTLYYQGDMTVCADQQTLAATVCAM